jgi:hypothetical protein
MGMGMMVSAGKEICIQISPRMSLYLFNVHFDRQFPPSIPSPGLRFEFERHLPFLHKKFSQQILIEKTFPLAERRADSAFCPNPFWGSNNKMHMRRVTIKSYKKWHLMSRAIFCGKIT